MIVINSNLVLLYLGNHYIYTMSIVIDLIANTDGEIWKPICLFLKKIEKKRHIKGITTKEKIDVMSVIIFSPSSIFFYQWRQWCWPTCYFWLQKHSEKENSVYYSCSDSSILSIILIYQMSYCFLTLSNSQLFRIYIYIYIYRNMTLIE